MRRDVDSAQIGHMIGRVIGLVFAHRDAAASLALALSIISEARRSAVPLASVTMPATATPCRLRLPPGGLAVKTAVGIAGARMRVVLALLSVEIGPVIFV